MAKKTPNDWAKVFRGLGNPNRIRIIRILSEVEKMSVTDLSEELKITLKNTSRNLSILHNLGLVDFQGKSDHVYYSLNSGIEREIESIIKIILG